MGITKLLANRLALKVLSFFLSHENEEFYLRQLASILAEDPSNLSKIIKKISTEGLLLVEIKGKEKYFHLNTNHPLYQEIKKLIEKTVGLQASLATELKGFPGLKKAFIYGSLASGNLSSASDIDLFLLGKIDENKLLFKIKKLEQDFGREINYILLTEDELKRRISSDSFIKAIWEGSKIDLI